jgi:hypothetical protein
VDLEDVTAAGILLSAGALLVAFFARFTDPFVVRWDRIAPYAFLFGLILVFAYLVVTTYRDVD